jgi:hypothetical protein
MPLNIADCRTAASAARNDLLEGRIEAGICDATALP